MFTPGRRLQIIQCHLYCVRSDIEYICFIDVNTPVLCDEIIHVVHNKVIVISAVAVLIQEGQRSEVIAFQLNIFAGILAE